MAEYVYRVVDKNGDHVATRGFKHGTVFRLKQSATANATRLNNEEERYGRHFKTAPFRAQRAAVEWEDIG